VRMHPNRAHPEEARLMQPRSWLFVPADSEKKIAKALDSDADAIIFDLEDSVAPTNKSAARELLKRLPQQSEKPQLWVRVNPIGSEFHRDDLHLMGVADIHGIVLPKTESGADVIELAHRTGSIPIHAIVTESAASLFNLLSYRDPKSPLAAMSWGAEDLSAALGASSKYDADGSLSFTYRLARSLCLAGAAAAGVQPVDGVFADFRDEDGLKAETEAARREGFTGKLAIHPAQVPVINAAFTPSADALASARDVLDRLAAAQSNGSGVALSADGQFIDEAVARSAREVVGRAG
jgi:citrate lyase subunit beta/citryl-CoA lyase